MLSRRWISETMYNATVFVEIPFSDSVGIKEDQKLDDECVNWP